ncbi:MAG: hypothetical protein EOP08_16475 [Proteobacteria bacterium]|nr:MAG: hypothetical protein EOP08_16475 [Pseudomonadota bacterium]
MHRAFLLLLPTLAAFSASGCIVGNANGQPYSEGLRSSYTGFDQVDSSAGVEVVVIQGKFDVSAMSPNNSDMKNLIVEVRGNTLHVGRKQTMGWGGDTRYRVNVSAPAYTGFEASSGSSITGSNLQLADVEIDVSSGASIELSGACKTLRAKNGGMVLLSPQSNVEQVLRSSGIDTIIAITTTRQEAEATVLA